MDSEPSSGPYGASIIYIEVSPKYLRWTVILAVAPNGASIFYIEVSPKYLRWTVILAVAPMVPPLFILKSALNTYDGQ